MKKFCYLILSALIFTVLSCREDSNLIDGSNQFSLKVDRDTDFISKNIGETNELKFNIIPDYDFNSVETTFSFTTDKNGTLTLNGNTLSPNTSYAFSSKNNMFKYVGNESGQHELKIVVKNSKGFTKEERFNLNYSQAPDFSFSATPTATAIDVNNADLINLSLDNTGNSAQTFQIKAELISGTGTFNIPTNTYTNVMNGNSTMSFTPTSTGAVKVKLTVKNNFGISKEVILSYTSSFFGFVTAPILTLGKTQTACCLYASNVKLTLNAKTRESHKITHVELKYYRRNNNQTPSLQIKEMIFTYTPPSPVQQLQFTDWFNNILDYQAGSGANVITLLEEKYTVTFYDDAGNSFSQQITPNVVWL
ncbi:TraQ conjugal transfer family protein [Chryseobacterium sp. SL1]|uniref:TraQ conjugal transfer family protein n=1 Tax=Chryseobacterium sp. SL1 TaxID=2995159 RepID=UPI0022759B22|nr:TraQ conjugal transfer family protein [Chryseobacterium sp. SL1]MCY1659307.1 TraQ conjugal transfer family protein [Chryseobacterium sp. SL1]